MQPFGRSRRQTIELRPVRPLRYATLSDPILVQRTKDGDRAALSALCERHAPRVERPAGHLLSDPEDAGDAAQEALAKVCSQQARVVVLKDGFDWSFAEIASQDGIPVGTAKCYAHRARNSLRQRLAQ